MTANIINDTIAAISTAIGEAGIGIVRISGPGALDIADRIFVAKDIRQLRDCQGYTTHYGWIAEKEKRGRIIDEVLINVMRSPRSYTREDIIEINCHGGALPLREVLELVLRNGCRLAEPGEFTKRAFLNGRIDLAQAEAVLDIIKAKTDAALKMSAEQLRGGLSAEINSCREALIEALSLIEADIDFPEDTSGSVDLNRIGAALKESGRKISGLLSCSGRGRIIREGVKTVICGRPNVGKSSILNALLRQERSLVTSVAGTTRDTIEEFIDIRGIPIRIIDTAGILEPRDLIERKAVQRAKRYIEEADLVLLIFDGSRKLVEEDRMLIKRLKSKQNVIAVVNKIDKTQNIKKDDLAGKFTRLVEISAKNYLNINLLEDSICEAVYRGEVVLAEAVLVSNLRHIESLRCAQKLIAEASDSLDNKLPAEYTAQLIKDASSYLDEMLGKRITEDVLERIFGEFCIGK